MKLFGSLLMVALCFAAKLDAQIRFKLELLPDNTTYRISMASDVTWTFPQNLTSSAQITIRVPHAEAPLGFITGDLVSLQPSTEWDDNVRINAPVEAPEWDYISFSLISGATGAFNYVASQEIPLFEFVNAAQSCLGTIEIIDNQTDPFLPPNSVSANIPNAIVTLGGGLMNAYIGNIGDATEPCLPVPTCTVFGNVASVTLCPGEQYGGQLFQQDTVLQQHFLTQMGCDSILSTQIEVLEPVTTTASLLLCEGSSFQGVAVFSDTVFTQTLLASTGCDSIVVTEVEVVSFFQENLSVQVCEGQTYAGITIGQDTSFTLMLTTANGCDSLVQVQVEVTDAIHTQVSLGFCEGTLYNGQPLTSNTSFSTTYPSSGGCDSIVTTLITVWPLPQPVISLAQADCSDLLSVGVFDNYLWNNGLTTASVSPQTAATYAVTVTNSFGCQASASFEYTGHANLQAAVTVDQPGCGTGKSGAITFSNVTGGEQPYLFSIDGGQTFHQNPVFENLPAGNYGAVVEDGNGCRWEEQPAVEIEAAGSLVLLGSENQRIHLGESVRLEATTNFQPDTVFWEPALGVDCPNCLKTNALPPTTTRYRLTVVDPNGCTHHAQVYVVVDEHVRAFIPTAFSPNDDGFNDFFNVFAAPEVASVKTMKVFDRQGGLVFSQSNLPPNSPTAGWAGDAHGKPVSTGVFTYYVELELITGEIVPFAGDVTVVR